MPECLRRAWGAWGEGSGRLDRERELSREGFQKPVAGWKVRTLRSIAMMAATYGSHSVPATAGRASNTATVRVSWRLCFLLLTACKPAKGCVLFANAFAFPAKLSS